MKTNGLDLRKKLINKEIVEEPVSPVNFKENFSKVKKPFYKNCKEAFIQELVNRLNASGLYVVKINVDYDNIDGFLRDSIDVLYKNSNVRIVFSHTANTVYVDRYYGHAARTIRTLIKNIEQHLNRKEEIEYDVEDGGGEWAGLR